MKSARFAKVRLTEVGTSGRLDRFRVRGGGLGSLRLSKLSHYRPIALGLIRRREFDQGSRGRWVGNVPPRTRLEHLRHYDQLP